MILKQKLLCRYSVEYNKAIQSDKPFKTSNRNAVLLGLEKFVRNTGFEEWQDDGDSKKTKVDKFGDFNA